jgi:hypothetical protein
MRQPISIRPLTEDEQPILQEGLRSSDACVLRRCQVLLTSARGQTARVIAETLSCDAQTVLNAIHTCNTTGLTTLHGGRLPSPACPGVACRPRAMLSYKPR